MKKAVLRGAVLVGFLALVTLVLDLFGPASVEHIDTVLGPSGLLIALAGYGLLTLVRWVW